MTDHAPMPYFDNLIKMKLATGPFRPLFPTIWNFDGLIKLGIQDAERARA